MLTIAVYVYYLIIFVRSMVHILLLLLPLIDFINRYQSIFYLLIILSFNSNHRVAEMMHMVLV